MWIDRVISETPQGPAANDLHERLTVIASANAVRRREVYNQILTALRGAPSTLVEVRTEYGDKVTAQRNDQGASALYDSTSKLPIHSDTRGLGVVGQLNSPEHMAEHLELFHVTADRLRAQAKANEQSVHLARQPLDQLFKLASQITENEATLDQTQSRRSDLTKTIREREDREQTVSNRLEQRSEGQRKIGIASIASIAIVVAGVVLAGVLEQPTIGGGLVVAGLIIAAAGHFLNKRSTGDSIEGEALEIQLGRVGELFDTHDLTQSRREAEKALTGSHREWRALAGTASPASLLNDRPRIEELASHLRLIENEGVESGDKTILIGFAALLAELTRRFPSERVPLLVDDLFAETPPQYHGVLRELVMRASHRRQVIVETENETVAKWAAVEAVGGDALLISDYNIDVEPIINQAVAAETGNNV